MSNINNTILIKKTQMSQESEENEICSTSQEENKNLLNYQESMREILNEIKDENGVCLLNNEVLENTPKRFLKAFMEFTSGYYINDRTLLQSAIFASEGYNNIIIVDEIKFDSLCEHHLLPFSGVVNIGYIPDKDILGLSKFARLVEVFSKRLSLQERLTVQIANSIESNLKPLGVVVDIDSVHSCMCVRGVKSKGSSTKTMITLGKFKEQETLNQYFQLRK